jgi:hypothetical protein
VLCCDVHPLLPLQYMVLDLKRFQPRRQLQEGLLWVAEQLPGVVEAADMTQVRLLSAQLN